MKLYSSVFFNVLRTSTALALLSISSVSAFAMDQMEIDENLTPSITKGYISSKDYKPVPFSLNPSYGAVAIERNRKGNPWRITTDSNHQASYQLESNRFPVHPNDVIQISYKIMVQPGGKISLGCLNEKRNGWYGDELVLIGPPYDDFKPLSPKTYQGVYELTVPLNESITSLVFRNYHLDGNGGEVQSIFTIEEIDIQKKEAFWFNSTGLSKSVKQEENGQITVTTDHNNWASYQLESTRVPVESGDFLKINYKFTVQPGGKVSMGCLSTSRNWWYPSSVAEEAEEKIFEAGDHQGTFERFVPAEEKETSLVFRNYHLGAPGQSTFTIEYLDFQNEGPGYRPFPILPNDLIEIIFQHSSLQTIGRFSRASQACKKLGGNSSAIWAHLMKQHNYPTLTNCPDLRDATKFDFMAHHFGYAQFNKTKQENNTGPISHTIKIKNLLALLSVFPPNANKESYFNIGEDSFMLIQCNIKFVSQNMQSKSKELVQTHSLELLNPEANVTFEYHNQEETFQTIVPAGKHTSQEIEFNNSMKQFEAYIDAFPETREFLEYTHNRFYIKCITQQESREQLVGKIQRYQWRLFEGKSRIDY